MKLPLRRRVLLTIASATILCTLSSIWVSRIQIYSNGFESLASRSRAILSRLEVARDYVANMKTLDAVLADVHRKHPDGNLSQESKERVLKSVPIYASIQIGVHESEKENYQFRISSDSPRNQKNKATPHELELIQKFQRSSDLKEIVEPSEDGRFLVVTRPVRIRAEDGCLTCHGAPATSPWGNGKDILGYQMEDMKDGEIRGLFSVISDLKPVHAATEAATRQILLWALIVTAFVMLLGYGFLRESLTILSRVADQILSGAENLAQTATQIAESSQQLSSGSHQSADALHQTVSAVTEIRAVVASNAQVAEETRRTAQQSHETSIQGQQTVGQMISAIGDISNSNSEIMRQTEQGNREISNIVGVISEIGNKTKVINDIVFQTKLLSFNASVEAARAGEHGKGFAVVAEEIGNLAQMSGNAAEEIASMLKDSLEKVDAIAKESQTRIEGIVNKGRERVEIGTHIAEDCQRALGKILNDATRVQQMVSTIADASKEQTRGVDDITRAISQIDQITKANDLNAHDTAEAGEHLREQSLHLNHAVQDLFAVLQGTSDPTVSKQNQGNGGISGSHSAA